MQHTTRESTNLSQEFQILYLNAGSEYVSRPNYMHSLVLVSEYHVKRSTITKRMH